MANHPALRSRRRSPLSWLYVVLITLWLVLRAIFFDQIWWLALVNTFAIYLFVPLPLLLVAALLRRRWALMFGLAIPTAAFIALFGTLLLPRLSTPLPDTPTITAMSFNVLTSNKDTDALIGTIRAARPDILGMQELTNGKRAALKTALGQALAYHTLDWPRSYGNVGLMTRFPIETAQPITLPSGQPALHAILRVGEQQLHVFVAHLSPNHLFKNPEIDLATAASTAFARRAAEINRLGEELHDLDAPAILLCDCNLTDTSQAHADLRSFLADSAGEAGWGLQLTNYVDKIPFLGQRIDYVWHSADLIAVAAEVGNAGGSDHLPVVARLRLRQ
ncbi:MAG TPA: endonuclease/exonuclease/phosphatase family protein [Roseiflexaceae bacterium]|nr:endonuclease/exonuclease/phosphatase family protein [Roseiflexaceae bacterium]